MANKLDLAIAQFTGFTHARAGFGIKQLAEGMGLTKKEWLQIRDAPQAAAITDSEKKEIDAIFKL